MSAKWRLVKKAVLKSFRKYLRWFLFPIKVRVVVKPKINYPRVRFDIFVKLNVFLDSFYLELLQNIYFLSFHITLQCLIPFVFIYFIALQHSAANAGVKYARIWVLSKLYFPESTILSLYGKIRIRENPYSGILYAVKELK